jgi:hypothetical protein
MTVAIWFCRPFGQEKHHSGDTHGGALLVVIEFVENQHPHRHGNERHAEDQRSVCGLSTVTQAPRAPAMAWLAMVANKMPNTMGHLLAKPGGQHKREQLGLSPIFASATIPVETKSFHERLLPE